MTSIRILSRYWVKFIVKKIVIKKVENGTAGTINDILRGNITSCSIFVLIDTHNILAQLIISGLRYNVLNYTVGFVASDGTRTNNIEGFWSPLKFSVMKHHGVKVIKDTCSINLILGNSFWVGYNSKNRVKFIQCAEINFK